MILSTRPSPIAAAITTDDPFTCLDHNGASAAAKRKRRPAGTPDPDAEVVSLSPRTLMESDRYVCEICNQGFQRDQNLQMHRRRHKVPWKLLKRVDSGGAGPAGTRKRVYVCPEPSCLHHDPCHALGDLVGIKKHFRRKHSSHRQWVCARCSKAYAVQSDFKAHLKTCGTRGHTCDCGRVFSRVESFIEHQDCCNIGRIRSSDDSHNNVQRQPSTMPPCRSTPPSPTSDQTLNPKVTRPWTPLTLLNLQYKKLELENHVNDTVPCPNVIDGRPPPPVTSHNLELQLSLGSSEAGAVIRKPEIRVDDYGRAVEEKGRAEEARRESRREVEEAEREFDNARRMRQRAQAELNKAQIVRQQAMRQAQLAFLQVTCRTCKQSYMSSITEGDVKRE